MRSRLQVDVEDLDLDLLANLDDLGRMVDMAPRQLGDVHQAVDAAEVDESAEVDDGGNVPLRRMPLVSLERTSARSCLAALFEDDAAGQDDVVAVAVHLDDAGLEVGAQVGI
jgi:hypothetical protein